MECTNEKDTNSHWEVWEKKSDRKSRELVEKKKQRKNRKRRSTCRHSIRLNVKWGDHLDGDAPFFFVWNCVFVVIYYSASVNDIVSFSSFSFMVCFAHFYIGQTNRNANDGDSHIKLNMKENFTERNNFELNERERKKTPLIYTHDEMW